MVQFRFLLRATLAAMAAAILLPTMLVRAWQMKQAPLMTDWAAQVDSDNPWPEYPRPQMVRTNWLNLNGVWQFLPGATNNPLPTGNLSGDILFLPATHRTQQFFRLNAT